MINSTSTVYNNKLSIEIRARNNALGLPLIVHNSTPIEYNVGVNVEQCTFPVESCKWEKKNFEESPADDYQPLMPNKKESRYLYINRNMTRNLRFFKQLEFDFSTTDSYGHMAILLLDAAGDIASSDMYYIQLLNGRNGPCQLFKCSSSVGSTKQNIIGRTTRLCRLQDSEGIPNHMWGGGYDSPYSNEKYTFRISFYNGVLHCHVTWKAGTVILFHWTDPSPFKVRYFTFGTLDVFGHMLLHLDAPQIWNLTANEGSFSSPSFVPGYSNICVSVTYFKNSSSELQLSVLKPGGNKLNLVPTHTYSMAKGWENTRFVAQLPDDMQRQNVTVQLTAQAPDGSKFLIQRIGGCNGEDSEDILELSQEEAVQLPEHGYDVAVQEIAPNSTAPIICQNGGQFDSDRGGCICPAGFIGKICQTGCGKNSYGSKCDARCSLTTRGCQGMKLCRPKLSCLCAPGLKGTHCDTHCEAGEFGAECQQRCGRCKNAHCDPYTGRCPHGCHSGYFPPYCKETYKHLLVAPDISPAYTELTIAVSLRDTKGIGSPKFYQIQYRKSSTAQVVGESWLELRPMDITTEDIVSNITGLEPATYYRVRVVLIDPDGSSYQGELVPTREVRTKCLVGDVVRYDLRLVAATESSLQVAWNFPSDVPLWCPVSHFVVEWKEHSRWFLHSQVKNKTAEFTDLLPGQQYSVRVKAVTLDGPSSYSNILTGKTRDEAPSNVFEFELVSTTESEIAVKWTPPLVTGGTITSYRVTYQCQKLLSCEASNCSNNKGQVDVRNMNNAVLRRLLPHAQYSVSVAALAAAWGPATEMLAATKMADPGVAPDASSSSAIVEKTNTSLKVQWEPPNNCTSLNGYLQGYRYQLLDGNMLIKEAKTQLTVASFEDLTPHVQYTFKVFLETSKGWNPNHPLVIPVATRATTPGPVEQLTVYKRGRRMLGVRWAKPKLTYGEIESFTVSYQSHLHSAAVNTVMLKSTTCVAWPHLYCHTLSKLLPDSNYTISVRARNVDVPEDGEVVAVTALTKESLPDAPSFIRIVSQTQTDLKVEWGLPDMLNGVLRSFLVNVEGTDAYHSEECCQYFPVTEVTVRDEKASFQLQIPELQSASTYTIGVTAKTVSLGPAVTITAHTRPPVPSMDDLLQLKENSNASLSPTVIIRRSIVYEDLIKGYLIIVLPQEEETNLNATIWNSWLSEEIDSLTNTTFYIAAEYEHSDLKTAIEFRVGTGTDEMAGTWGVVQNPELQEGRQYRIGLVAILEYCGVLNVGYTELDFIFGDNNND
ncbi:uncharacterized protein [Periplaneta americana]